MSNKAKAWRSRKVIPASIVVVAVLVVAALAAIPRPKNDAAPTPRPPVNVEVLTVRALPEFTDTFVVPAVVEPDRIVNVAAEVAGRIDRLGSEEGRPCRQGDKLIYLNTELLQAEYDRAKAQADYDRWELDRVKELVEQNAATANELELTRSKADASRAALKLAAEQLARAVIVAPVNGILNRLPVEEGEYVTPGKLVAEIVNIDEVKVVAMVPERDIGYLRVGDSGTVLVRAEDIEGSPGKIAYISELADELTRTTRVEIQVDNRDRLLRSGQVVRAALTRQVLKDVIVIPLRAIIPLENGKAVYVVVAGKAQRRDVELGFLKRDEAQLLPRSDLHPGDQLILKGKEYVAPDQAVRVVIAQDQASERFATRPATSPATRASTQGTQSAHQ